MSNRVKDGVDAGTSPHGLSVGIELANQETGCSESLRFHAKPVLGVAMSSAALGVYSFTEEQRCALAFAALCQAEGLTEGYEAHMEDVQEAIARLWEAHFILNGSQS